MKLSYRLVRPLIYVSIIITAVLFFRLANPAPRKYEESFNAFGTYGKITFWHPDKDTAEETGEEIVEQLQTLSRRLNIFTEDSELSQLNSNAASAPFKCSPRLWQVLQKARRAYEQTDGSVDISIGPLMDLWGFHGGTEKKYPSAREVADKKALCGLDKVDFNEEEKKVVFSKPGMYLDLGAIAKGYALDLAVETAVGRGIEQGIIDIGGNIYVFPKPPPNRENYHVGIRAPHGKDDLLAKVEVTDCFIATSGNYENAYQLDGKTVHHIIDPDTGYPVENIASVTALAETGVQSDAFSTAVFIKGWDFAQQLCIEHNARSFIRMKDKEGEQVVEALNWKWPLPE